MKDTNVIIGLVVNAEDLNLDRKNKGEDGKITR